MTDAKKIWVLPEIAGSVEESSKTSLGLLTEAADIAAKVNGAVTALLFTPESRDYSEVLGQYGIGEAMVFIDPVFEHPSAEAVAAALAEKLEKEPPWLVILGDTPLGRELAPLLAVRLNAALISDCARLDLADPEQPVGYRYVYGDQLYQEVAVEAGRTLVLTMDSRVLNVTPVSKPGKVKVQVVKPKLSPEKLKIKHLDYLPVDYRSVDVAEADTVIGAGMGAIGDDLLPLVEELAALVEGTVGTTRPVVDEGKIPREKMIGQTGRVISPELYLALGISGATHHTGGIQASGKIVAVNRDPQAAIFQIADVGAAADLREVLPALIERIKKARANGEIL